MGISFDKNLRIIGYRPATFKNALIGFMRTGDPGAMVDLKTVFAHRHDGAIVFEECLDRGLIADTQQGLAITPAGEAIASGKAKARASYAAAQRVLDGLIDRAIAMDANAEAVEAVEKIWLFGSLARKEETVGDIDVAIVTSRRTDRFSLQEASAHAQAVLKQDGAAASAWMPWMATHKLTHFLLFGERRHPLLAGAQTDDSNLKDLGVPCRLVYDRNRGGRVSDPLLPRHPDSAGRRNDMPEARHLPDLTPALLRPMNARWIAGYKDGYQVSPYEIYRGWTDDAHKLFPRYPRGLRVLTQAQKRGSDEWMPNLVKQAGVDGRHRAVVLHHPSKVDAEFEGERRKGVAVLLERSFERTVEGLSLHVKTADVETWRGHKTIAFEGLFWIARAIALIAAVDAERALRRSNEAGKPDILRIQVDDRIADRDGVLGAMIEGAVSDAIRIEPTDWTGPSVIVDSAASQVT